MNTNSKDSSVKPPSRPISDKSENIQRRIFGKYLKLDEEAMKLKYEIIEGAVPVADYNSFIVVTKGSNPNESNVTWVGRFYRVYKLNPPIPAGQDDESALKAVNEIYDAGLPALKKLAESK